MGNEKSRPEGTVAAAADGGGSGGGGAPPGTATGPKRVAAPGGGRKADAGASPGDGDASADDTGSDRVTDEEVEDVTIDADLRSGTAGGGADGKRDISVDDFDLLKVLGKGSYGKVMLVRYKGDEKLYAMKTLRKATLLRRNQVDHTKTERAVLQAVDHPFIVKLRFAFQTRDKLYLVTDYAPGGELFFWLKRERVFSQTRVRLYAAELVLALEHLHSKNIVYRDLKPENILLDAEGHIKITDFGLSKGNVRGFGAEGGTNTFCGTPEYLAPEILDERRWHGKAVDWWSLGTLLYEMCAGLPPFYDENVEVMYEKIMSEKLTFPRHFLPETRDLLARMLERDVTKRLGYNGADEIKEHKFFAGLDWDAVLGKTIKPSFVPPAARNESDVANFEDEFTTQAPVDSMPDPKGDLSATAVEKTHFENFTYVGTADALVGHASPSVGGIDPDGAAAAGGASRGSKSRGPASREVSSFASPESTPTARPLHTE